MRIEKDKCNHCGMETSDRYLEIGWIHIDTTHPNAKFAFSFSLGRAENGHAQTAHFSDNVLDFCGMPCLLAFFRDGIRKRKDQLQAERAS